MVRLLKFTFYVAMVAAVSACGPVKSKVQNQYKLNGYSSLRLARHHSNNSLLVKTPTAMAGYRTNQMIYVTKPYRLDSFVKNQWVDTPANMLMPLLVQSMIKSNYFYAVASVPYTGKYDYRLDTTLLKLQQNFISKPSRVEVVIKALVVGSNNRLIAAQTFSRRVTATSDNPYGGVIAANKAIKSIMQAIAKFTVRAVRRTQSGSK